MQSFYGQLLHNFCTCVCVCEGKTKKKWVEKFLHFSMLI